MESNALMSASEETNACDKVDTTRRRLVSKVKQLAALLVSLVCPRVCYDATTGRYDVTKFVAPPNDDHGASERTLVNREIYGNFIASTRGAVVARFTNGVSSIIRMAPIEPKTVIMREALPGLDMVCFSDGDLYVPTTEQTNVMMEPDLSYATINGRSLACCVKIFIDANECGHKCTSCCPRHCHKGVMSAACVGNRAIPNYCSATMRVCAARKKDCASVVKAQTGVVLVQGHDVKRNAGIIAPSNCVSTQSVTAIKKNVNCDVVLDGRHCTVDQPYARGPDRSHGCGAAFVTYGVKLVPTKPTIFPPAIFCIDAPSFDNIVLRITAEVDVESGEVDLPPWTRITGTVTTIAYFACVEPPSDRLNPSTDQRILLTCSILTEQITSVVKPKTDFFKQQSGAATTIFVADHRQKDEYCTWIGTFVTCSNAAMGTGVRLSREEPLTTTRDEIPSEMSAPVFSSPTSCVRTFTKILNIDAIAKNLYNETLTGPAHVAVWDDVKPGQNILVSGHQICEITPMHVVTPFFNRGYNGAATAVNYWQLVTAAFESESKLCKRVYTGDEWDKAVEVISRMTVEDLFGPNPLFGEDEKLMKEIAVYLSSAEPEDYAPFARKD